MKKLLKFLPLALLALVGLTAMSCSDNDDNDRVVSTGKLPAAAKSFLMQYYPKLDIVTVEEDHDDFTVYLSDGTSAEFNKKGEWTDVDAPLGMTVAKGFYPASIDTYVEENYPSDGVNEISKEKRGYDVELVSGTDLIFNSEGVFISVDAD